MTERKLCLSELEHFFVSQRKEIVQALVQYRYEIAETVGGPATLWRPLYNPVKRWLSEMPLCGGIYRIRLPEGFRTVNDGSVLLKSSLNNKLTEQVHIFAQDRNGAILCFTPGEFVGYPFSDEDLSRGERIERLRTKAPELIHIIDNQRGVAFLYGTKETICQKLGLIYRENGGGNANARAL